MVTIVCKETQKKAFGGEIVHYPVQKIFVKDKNIFYIACRDSAAANTFKESDKAYQQAIIVEKEMRNYELKKKTQTDFILQGEDAQKVLSDYADTGLLSQKLLREVISAVSDSPKQPCVIL